MKIDVIDKGFDMVVKALPIPDVAEKGIIATKNFLADTKIVKNIFEGIEEKFKENKSIFENIENIKDIFNKETVVELTSKVVDTVIKNAKNQKVIDTSTAKILRNSKEYLLDKVVNLEKESLYKGQEEILNSLQIKQDKWEEAFKKADTKNMNQIYISMKEEIIKLLPTQKVIERIKEIENLNELATAKIKNGENSISDLEKEILRKVS